MDLINNTTTVNTNPDAETETPPPPSLLPPPPHTTQLINNNSLSFTNGSVLKRHKSSAVVVQVSYKECLKNHAASLGGHALDGCGEFMPSPTSTPTDPTSLKCAACGCHRNFHRREPDEPTTTTHFLRFHHHPSPHRRSNSSSPSPSPPPPPQPQPQPPPSSTYYSSAPHMLLALSTAVSGPSDDYNPSAANQNSAIAIKSSTDQNPSGKKRNRTKFSQEQKEKMYTFSEKLGWKMQKSEEGVVEDFCNEIGVRKGVLKVWMHNNKYTFSKRDSNYNNSTLNGSSSNNGTTGDIRINSFDTNGGSHSPINGTNISSISHHHHHGHPHHHHHNNEGTTNGSSSSS